MKVLLISDTHFKVFENELDQYGYVEKTIDYFMDIAEQKQVDKIMHLGDVFHVKNILTEKALTKVADIFAKLSTYSVEVLVGNHDKISKNNESHLLKVFKNFPNIEIIEGYEQDKNFHYLPYFDEEKIIDISKTMKMRNGEDNYLFGHFGVNGFAYQIDGYTDPQLEITPSLFKNFKMVYLGHFHDHQKRGNIMYIGSPYGTKFGESSRKGFLYIDTDKKTTEFIKNPFAPKYVEVEVKKSNLEYIKSLKNSFVKLNFPASVSKETAIRFNSSLKKENFVVKNSYHTDRRDDTIAIIQGWDEFIKADCDMMIDDFIDYLEKNNALPDTAKNLKKTLRE